MGHYQAREDIVCSDRTVFAGEIFEASPQPKGVFIATKGSMGYLIPYDRCQRVDLISLYQEAKQENLMHSENVRALMIERDELKRLDDKLVVLPVKVAEAIEFLRNADFSDYGIIALSDQTSLLGRDYRKEIIDALQVVRSYTFINTDEDLVGDSGANIILKALVNGYTVETIESKINAEVLAVCNKYDEETGYGVFGSNKELSQRITEAVTQIIREDGAAG